MDAVKDTEVAPAGTVTDVGIVRAAALSVSVTTVPPVGAGFDIVTVHLVLLLGAKLAAVHCRLEMLVSVSESVVL